MPQVMKAARGFSLWHQVKDKQSQAREIVRVVPHGREVLKGPGYCCVLPWTCDLCVRSLLCGMKMPITTSCG